MARIIPNQNSFIGFSTTAPTILESPTDLEVASSTNVTQFVISLTANSQGNTVPTPSLDTLFETSVPGTSTASFTGDFYRDDNDDAAWLAFERGTKGYFYISRFGGTGTNHEPIAGEHVEVWPVIVTSRSASSMASNTAQTFTLTCAVPVEPAENAVVIAN